MTAEAAQNSRSSVADAIAMHSLITDVDMRSLIAKTDVGPIETAHQSRRPSIGKGNARCPQS